MNTLEEDSKFWVLCPRQNDSPEMVYGEGADYAALNWVAEDEEHTCEYPVAAGLESRTLHVYTDCDYQKAIAVKTTDWMQIPHETFVVAGESIPHYYIEK
jgi:hypothetical protein